MAHHRGSAPITLLEAEMGVHSAWLYEAIGWLVRDGSLTFDPEHGVVALRRSGEGPPAAQVPAP
ncbi:MAG: hypothetical protein HYR85_10645 [Planctomycetes bacterium]|nr:hypothetical protein [Planctomycetota bacterium]MBI3847996.1 hypothetical protein [Planctomycetota bacterium]